MIQYQYQYQYYCRRKEGRGNLLVMECLVEETPVLPRKVSVPGNYPGMLYIHHDDEDEDDEDDDDDDDDDDDVNGK